MNSPAEKCGAVVGDDDAPEWWCSYDVAVGRLRAARGLSEGAARNQADEAIASGNVQRRGRWKHQSRKLFGQDFVPISALVDMFFIDTFLTDIELNFADFCAQIELQIGSPRSRVALPSAPGGTRTNRAADAETAAGEWLRVRRGQPKMTKAAALEAITADIGPLSGSAFRRAWDVNVDPQWKKPGAPRKKIP
jgi:hypothetical protein